MGWQRRVISLAVSMMVGAGGGAATEVVASSPVPAIVAPHARVKVVHRTRIKHVRVTKIVSAVSAPNADGKFVSEAAVAMLGTPYIFGSARPHVGFDCSGLTSWAWALVGVELPHSAEAQNSTLHHVSLSKVQPGDIIYYNSASPHVAVYVGKGQIIHARHPGSLVQSGGLFSYDQPIAAMRPVT